MSIDLEVQGTEFYPDLFEKSAEINLAFNVREKELGMWSLDEFDRAQDDIRIFLVYGEETINIIKTLMF